MKSGEAKLHTGIVVDAYNDMSIKVTVRSFADTDIDDVGPEAVSALRWRPRIGDKVRILERVAPLRPEKALTWLGWAWDPEDTRLFPEWLEADEVALLSQDGVVGVVLEDVPEVTTGRTQNVANWPAATDPALRLGAQSASESLICGQLYQTWMASTTQALIDLADAVETIATALAVHLHPTAVGPSGPPDNAATYTAQSTVAGASEATITTRRGELNNGDQLSEYAFTSKRPEAG